MIYQARLAVFFLFAAVLFGQATPFRGRVTDTAGSSIAGATVIVHWDPAGHGQVKPDNLGIPHDLSLKTGEDGSFAMELPPGFYDIIVSATAFTPTCRKVRVRITPSGELTFRLHVDPLVARELGTWVEPSRGK